MQFRGDAGSVATVVDGASFDLAAGEILGVLGESGGGKSTLALALLGLLPPRGRVVRGEVILRGRPAGQAERPNDADRDLLRMNERQLAAIRGEEISMVHQEPGISLSPCLRVGDQVADVVHAHRRWNRRRRREHALSLLERVRLEPPAEVYAAYPHQLSGGQRQRVAIAQALACEPSVVIADEPTAALDATTQARIVDLMRELNERSGAALIFISHDPALLASLADRLLVVYAGQIVEEGSVKRIYRHPAHPYTRELLRCAPGLARSQAAAGSARASRRAPLPVIPGAAPDPSRWPPGCRFEPRCPDRVAECRLSRPEMVQLEESRSARCLLHAG